MSEHILEAASAASVEHGPAGVTMDAVADKASVSKKTLYSRFRSKEALLAAVIDRTFARQVWSGPVDPGGSVAERLYGTLTAILKNTFKPEIIALERLFIDHHNEELQARVRATREVPVRMVAKLLMEAKPKRRKLKTPKLRPTTAKTIATPAKVGPTG